MTDEQIALAKRAVACKGWRWMPGMRARRDGRYWVGPTDVRVSDPMHDGGYPGFFPDLTDPATLGCLLALVREAWEDHTIVAKADPEEDMWYVVTRLGAAWSETEAASLVAALEAAP